MGFGSNYGAKLNMASSVWTNKDLLAGFKLGDPTSALILARQFEIIEDECTTVNVSIIAVRA